MTLSRTYLSQVQPPTKSMAKKAMKKAAAEAPKAKAMKAKKA